MKEKELERVTEATMVPYKRDFLCVAKEILGDGYVDGYYEIVISELRWAFREGFTKGILIGERNRCRCRAPKRDRHCGYCGSGLPDVGICGICKEGGIDGPVIRGTSRVVCKIHKKEKKK